MAWMFEARFIHDKLVDRVGHQSARQARTNQINTLFDHLDRSRRIFRVGPTCIHSLGNGYGKNRKCIACTTQILKDRGDLNERNIQSESARTRGENVEVTQDNHLRQLLPFAGMPRTECDVGSNTCRIAHSQGDWQLAWWKWAHGLV